MIVVKRKRNSGDACVNRAISSSSVTESGGGRLTKGTASTLGGQRPSGREEGEAERERERAEEGGRGRLQRTAGVRSLVFPPFIAMRAALGFPKGSPWDPGRLFHAHGAICAAQRAYASDAHRAQ